ncbi:hypothetical protein [Anderseniella sp. Alg231-50]
MDSPESVKFLYHVESDQDGFRLNQLKAMLVEGREKAIVLIQGVFSCAES